jgi:hypothetical protein
LRRNYGFFTAIQYGLIDVLKYEPSSFGVPRVKKQKKRVKKNEGMKREELNLNFINRIRQAL